MYVVRLEVEVREGGGGVRSEVGGGGKGMKECGLLLSLVERALFP